MTPPPVRFPSTQRPASEPVTWAVLQGALVGPLEEVLTLHGTLLDDLAGKIDGTASKQTRDREQLAAVQEGLRRKLDATEGTMAAEFSALRESMRLSQEAREARHGEVMTMLSAIAKKQDLHEVWHEGVKDGKHETGETLRIAASVQAAPVDHRAGDQDDDATRAVIAVARRLPWQKALAYLGPALGAALLAALQALTGCAHLSPSDRDDLAARGITAGVACVAEPLQRCVLGDAGWGAYLGCLWMGSAECAGEHLVAAAPAVLGMVLSSDVAQLAGVPGPAPYLLAVDRCVASLPEPTPWACRADDALSACGGRWVASCIDEQVSAAGLGVAAGR